MIKIKVWGVIDMQTSSIFETAVSSLENDKEPLLIVINSVGGTLSDSIAIRNLLDSLKNPIITVALGNCCSAAAMLFASGKHRYIGKDISYMIHQPYTPTIDMNQNYHKATIKQRKLKQYATIYKKGFKRGAKIPKEVLKDFEKGEDLYILDKKCLEYKIATHVFTNWDDLYANEKIDIANEKVVLFESILLETEAE